MSEKPAQPKAPPADKGGSGDKQAAAKPSPAAKPGKTRRRNVMAPLALVLAIIALLIALLVGWQWRAGRQARQQALQTATQVDRQVAGVQKTLASLETRVQSGESSLHAAQAKMAQAMQSAGAATDRTVQGLSQRVDQLEGAVAGLSQRERNGRQAALLDQAAMLLQLGQQRYVLFHDADGAAMAYRQAGALLRTAGDPALDGLVRAVHTERAALEAVPSVSRDHVLATLASVRAQVATLPLAPVGGKSATTKSTGFWQRVWHSLSLVLVVRREGAADLGRVSTHLTRQLTELDLAQAQAAYLAWDAKAGRAALERVAARLGHDFDTRSDAVRSARATIAALLEQSAATGAPVQLGGALQALRNLEHVRGAAASAATPGTAAAAQPAPAGSVGKPAGATP